MAASISAQSVRSLESESSPDLWPFHISFPSDIDATEPLYQVKLLSALRSGTFYHKITVTPVLMLRYKQATQL